MPPRAPDRRALALAIGAHAAILALLLKAHGTLPVRPDMPALAVFDVPPPPPPPPPVVSKPPPPRPPMPARKPACEYYGKYDESRQCPSPLQIFLRNMTYMHSIL